MANKSPSLREKVREFEKSLSGDAARVFREAYKKASESGSIQQAFVTAKKAVEKLPKTAEDS